MAKLQQIESDELSINVNNVKRKIQVKVEHIFDMLTTLQMVIGYLYF